ncbi:glycogen debranching N-terminal domain-containing protein [Isoptericola sp. b441]|uniref:Glycogen debranching N-terminal domain-containing protein n=1 Tax=Actinotalea lenta TaxID=3064654 RepID=A0ABT9DAD7_9CELL|nr:glycogen debranching N-terminal domain-containing protein [Isoptericola sp. b441]MDO8107850.1 glycogen debranching N-terminal domain-containing protein [Isoptericola sp. b441]
MTAGWEYEGGPPLVADAVTLVDGTTFCLSDAAGDIAPGTAAGLYVRDTRILSSWALEVDGHRIQPLAVLPGQDGFSAVHVARTPPPPGRADSPLLVLVDRRVGEGMCVQVTVRNLAARPTTCTVRVRVDADFADLFEVKEGVTRAAAVAVRAVRADGLWLQAPDRPRRALRVSGQGAYVGPDGLSWSLTLGPREQVCVGLEADAVIDGQPLSPSHRCGSAVHESWPAARMRSWRTSTASIGTADPGLAHTLERSVEDLGALQIADPDDPDVGVVAAGAPWYMALFGRDSLLTSLMALVLDQGLAVSTVRALAALQGTRTEPRSEEEPGKIPHETRHGPRARARDVGAYYGSVDATPLFVVAVGELVRFGLDEALLAELLPHVDRALDWMVNRGDRDGDGFVEYCRATPAGLLHQGWKDSFDAITFADGRPAEPPIALCEVQGYVYAAFRARSEMAAVLGDAAGARRWDERAARLREAFDARFWLPARGYLALGLDGAKRPIDALTSNAGHCLWSGIVLPERSGALAEQLVGARMFTGWGVRTLASDMAAYNPVSYHNGSVWPHDNALLAAGLMRYGHVDAAQRVAIGVLEAADAFDGRLPELFCGFDREEFATPVPYPTSCSPQAWASAAPLSLVRTLMRLEPAVPQGLVRIDPVVPWRYLPLEVADMPLAGTRVTIGVDPDGAHVGHLPPGIRIEGWSGGAPGAGP